MFLRYGLSVILYIFFNCSYVYLSIVSYASFRAGIECFLLNRISYTVDPRILMLVLRFSTSTVF